MITCKRKEFTSEEEQDHGARVDRDEVEVVHEDQDHNVVVVDRDEEVEDDGGQDRKLVAEAHDEVEVVHEDQDHNVVVVDRGEEVEDHDEEVQQDDLLGLEVRAFQPFQMID